LRRRRAEYAERSFAHLYDTGAMRRTYLRRHENILKRVLIHGSAFNLGLVMRQCLGLGTPRGLQGRRRGRLALHTCLSALWIVAVTVLWPRFGDRGHVNFPNEPPVRLPLLA
jgi:transposase